MPYTLNDKLKDLKPYDPISGDYSIRLDANESFLELPIELLEKAQYAMADIAFNRYPDPNATELCESFGAYYGIDPALVTAGNGSDEWLFIIASSFLMRGDKILTVEPDFSMYRFYGFLAEAESVVYQKKEDSHDRCGCIDRRGKREWGEGGPVFQPLQPDVPWTAPRRGAQADYLRFCVGGPG